MQNPIEIRWHPRIRQDKLKRLYEMDARGLVDEELIDDVGITLLLRCQSLMLVGRCKVQCPKCQQVFATGWEWTKRNETKTISCPHCQAWQCTGKQYRESFCRDALAAGNALAYFSEYIEKYPHASSYREKVLLIDRLIHQFHYATKWKPDTSEVTGRHEFPHAINGNNLIEGTHDAVLAFLDALTYGQHSPNETKETKAEWQTKVNLMRGTRRPAK